MAKPSIFIGSSKEGKDFAAGVRNNLLDDAEIQLWYEGFIRPGYSLVETFFSALRGFDFAILVLTPDDLLLTRETKTHQPRDNVVFELGLFMGHLGRDRTFLVHQSNSDIKIPSDLAGITLLGYEWSKGKRNYQQALGPACDKIRLQIRDHGVADRTNYPLWTNRLSQHAFDHDERVFLRKLILQQPCIIETKKRPDFENKLRHLADTGLAKRKQSIGPIFAKNDRIDIKEILEITEYGRQFIEAYNASKIAPGL